MLMSLPKRFHAKITTLEEAKDIDTIPLTEIFGNLQTHEMGLGKIGKGGKSRNMALMTIEEKSDDSKDEDEEEDKDITFIAKKIRKLLQYRKKDKNKVPRKYEYIRKGKSEKPPIHCHECTCFGHMRIECPSCLMKEEVKKSRGKVLVATLSDTKSDLTNEYKGERGNYMAFIATTNEVIMESASDREDSFDDEVPKKTTL